MGKHRHGNGQAEAGRPSADNAQAANAQQQQQQLPIPFAGQKKQSRINFGGGNADDEEEEERRSGPLSACDEFSSSSSSPSSTGAWLCLNRPLAASLGLIFLLLAIGQLFQLIRWIRRQNQHKIGNKNAKELEEEEMVHLPDPTHPPPPPCCSVAHSQSSVENLHRADLSYRRYSNNVFCLLCNNPPQFCRCGEGDGGGVEVERNRRQSYLSIETPVIARPVAQPRTQTVFPAEPYNSSSSGGNNGGHRKSANNGTGAGRDQQQQQRWEEHVSF